MRALHDLRNFLINTRWDFTRRDWIGRTINTEGYIRIFPDCYNAQMIVDLLRFVLSLDAEEICITQGKPRFNLIALDDIIAIDALWSLRGFHKKPFLALDIYRDVYLNGNKYAVPEIPFTQKPSLPVPRYYYVGKDWETDNWLGLRDPFAESLGECGFTTSMIKNGHTVLDVNVGDTFSVNEESANFILEYELSHLLDMKQNLDDPTYAFHFYMMYGAVSLAKSQRSRTDAILRRTRYRKRSGIDDLPLTALQYQGISETEMNALLRPEEQQESATPEDITAQQLLFAA